jgi:transposase
MNEKNHQEIAYRRRLFKLFDKGIRVSHILKLIPRSRPWVYKWKRRFEEEGFAALDSLDKAPYRSPHEYPYEVVALVRRVRQRLQRSCVGLVGARAIRRELKQHHTLKRVPSLASINRWLKDAKLLETPAAEPDTAYYPAPHLRAELVFHACDWTQRYLTGGEKVFAFHTVDLQTHALWQSVGQDKTTATVQAHALSVWQELGLPDFLQIDNDAAFTGLGKRARVFGTFVRLALYLGIELIFIPPGEAKRNHLVEGVNHLWSRGFWEKNDFTSWQDFSRQRGKFLTWYADYEPPALGGLSVRQASACVKGRKLKLREVAALPEELPLVAGRIHFIRRVSASGEIELLKERWKVSKRLQCQYVWATIQTQQQSLEIYHRLSQRAQPRLVKQYDYEIAERVYPLSAGYRRSHRAISVLELI